MKKSEKTRTPIATAREKMVAQVTAQVAWYTLIEQSYQGDGNALYMLAQKIALAHVRGMIRHGSHTKYMIELERGIYAHDGDGGDVKSVACMGLIEGLSAYHGGLSYKAYDTILKEGYKAVSRYIYKATAQAKKAPTSMQAIFDDEGDTDKIVFIPLWQRQAGIEKIHDSMTLDALISDMPISEKNRTLIKLLIAGHTISDIAKAWGVSAPAIHSRLSTIRKASPYDAIKAFFYEK